jgi:hypothetical protein
MSVKTTPAPDAIKSALNAPGWKTRAYIVGALIGIALGLLSAYLFIRASEESAGGAPMKVKTGDAMKASLAVLALIRQIAEMGGK